jgi:GGDEF domain-containing protein
MAATVSDSSVMALEYLFPLAKGRDDATSWCVDRLVEAELYRRGRPDSITGAAHVLALTQGALLKEEFDLSTHGHAAGWSIGAVLLDPREFMLFNMRYGFEAGHAALRAMVASLRSVCPKAKIVRVHTDGFAALLGPTAEQMLDDSMLHEVSMALAREVSPVMPDDGEPPRVMEYTLGLLEVNVIDPPNWQILGPLVWAECERALIIGRRTGSPKIARRTISLNGRLPE